MPMLSCPDDTALQGRIDRTANDAVVLERYSVALGKPPIGAAPDLPHVVIVGGGFGGIATARALRRALCRVTLIDQRNYHLFQPLLYQIATASLSPADIATPIRGLFREQWNLRVVLGRVTGVASRRSRLA
jgi:NADH:ubiquinone reductase (H+-translocating)